MSLCKSIEIFLVVLRALGHFSTRCTHFCERGDAFGLHSTSTVQKKALGPPRNFPLVGWVFHFSILEPTSFSESYRKLLNWFFFSGNENQSGRKFLCEFSTIFSPFFQIRAKLFWRLVRLNNPHSARGRWKWPSILQWSTSSKEPAGAKPLRREIKVPFLCWTPLQKLDEIVWPTFYRSSASLKQHKKIPRKEATIGT